MDENENFDEFIDTIEDLNHEGDQLIKNNDLTGAKAKYEKSFSLIQEISKFTDNVNS